jgi:hypothetical protein
VPSIRHDPFLKLKNVDENNRYIYVYLLQKFALYHTLLLKTKIHHKYFKKIDIYANQPGLWKLCIIKICVHHAGIFSFAVARDLDMPHFLILKLIEISSAQIRATVARDLDVLNRQLVVIRDLLICIDVARGEHYDVLHALDSDDLGIAVWLT